MKHSLAFALTTLMLACQSAQQTTGSQQDGPVDPVAYAASITEEELREHLYIYAADSLEGRDTGSEGQKKAVAYLKSEYEKLQVAPAQANGDYFQKVPLEVAKTPSGSITINDRSFPVGEHVLAFKSADGQYDEIIYVGYGIEEGEYSDYAEIDVKGKMVLVTSGEPQNEDGTYTLSGTTALSAWSDMSTAMEKKLGLAQEKGARGILYFDPNNYYRFKRSFDYMKNDAGGRMDLASEGAETFFVLFINEVIATALLPETGKEHGPKPIAAAMSLNIESANEPIDSENVVAVIKGTELPNEYVVISSHLDHIGINANGDINNGADDDGSGTVALLEIAEAFTLAAKAGHGPKRSMVFLHVTGEEKGLLGSQYYTDIDPIFPLENTVANLNIDMIGRIDPNRKGDRNYIYLIGSDKLSTELHDLSEAINTKYAGLELDYTYNDENDPNRFYYRSDHYNFAKNNIPIIFYFNGTHEDYHRPTDTPDKINYDLLENRTRLIFHTAWEVANRPSRLVVDKVAK
jgi:hypothetical protein